MTKSKEKIILVEEFQFFQPDLLKDAVRELRKQHKIIVMAGLNLDANRREWDSYTAMSEMCDREVQLKATCDVCGKHTAKFTKEKLAGQLIRLLKLKDRQNILRDVITVGRDNMKILSLFDGISSGRIALERANIPVEKYYASEIDKYAIQVIKKTIQILYILEI